MTEPERSGAAVPFRHSIGTRLFAGFIAMSLITAALGAYGLRSLSEVGQIVIDTYDRPLMAVNYAREASFTFARMDKEALRWRMAGADAQPAVAQALDELAKVLSDDLSVAELRSLGERARNSIETTRELVRRWMALARNPDREAVAQADALSQQITDQFDKITEETVDASFLERRQSVLTLQRFQLVDLGVIALAFALSSVIAYLLMRRIFQPLAQAAAVADRIGHGELRTPIPEGSPDETGILLNSLRAMRDRIRAMMESEQEQRLSAQGRLADAVESSQEGIVLLDAESRIELANTRFIDLLPQLVGVIEPCDGTPATNWIGTTLRPAGEEGRRIIESGGELLLPDGRWIRVARSPTRGGGFFLLLGDITELKRREEHLRAATQAAEAASVAKSQFLANMSHELRTPLNAIIGFSDMFIGEYFGPLGNVTYRDYAREINAGGWRLLELIQDVLDLSHSQSGLLTLQAEPIDLRETVEECGRKLAKTCTDRGLTLTVELPEEPLFVDGDRGKLRRAINNLTSNAVKFSKPEGRVALSAGGDAALVWIRIADNGIGMSEAEIPVALSAFGQVDAKLARRYEGSGLGLPLVKAFVDLHGGSIAIESALDQGTTVTVILARLAETVPVTAAN